MRHDSQLSFPMVRPAQRANQRPWLGWTQEQAETRSDIRKAGLIGIANPNKAHKSQNIHGYLVYQKSRESIGGCQLKETWINCAQAGDHKFGNGRNVNQLCTHNQKNLFQQSVQFQQNQFPPNLLKAYIHMQWKQWKIQMKKRDPIEKLVIHQIYHSRTTVSRYWDLFKGLTSLNKYFSIHTCQELNHWLNG